MRAARPAAPAIRMLVAATRAQALTLWRTPAFSATNLALPLVFFTFFGLPVAHLTSPDGVNVGAYLLASFGAYAVGSVMVFAFGVGVALERGMRIDLLLRATPLPPALHLAAKTLNALAFALVSLIVLVGYGVVVGGVRQDHVVWGALIARLLLGSLPFLALGLSIGYLASPQAAPAVANLVYLPLSFASGLFLPLDRLPHFVQTLAPFLPTYHVAQLAWGAVGAPAEAITTSVAWLAGYSAVFFAIAIHAYRADGRRRFA